MPRKRDTQSVTHESTRRTRRPTEPAETQQDASQTLPSVSASSLLMNPSIQRRGNGLVRQAAILEMQQSRGNRATQHALQHQQSAAVTAQGANEATAEVIAPLLAGKNLISSGHQAHQAVPPQNGSSPIVQRRSPGGAALVPVQRWDPPEMDAAQKQTYEAAAPSPLNNINDLIQLIERVEKAYSGDDWKGITTRIRKAYYNDALWDKLIQDRKDYGGVVWPPASVQDFKALMTAKNHPEINVNGESIDMGHVFTGLDSQHFPDVNWKADAQRVEGPPAATWSGDVGSALGEWDMNGGKDRSRRAEFYDRFASKDDMLGDVDGIAVSQLTVGGPGGIQGTDTLSNRLRAYYLGTGGAKSAGSQRFTKFTQASGFKWNGKGGGIKLDNAAQKKIRSQIDNFGVGYLRVKKGKVGGAGTNWFHDEDIDWFTKRFTDWIEQGLAAENP